MTDWQDKQNALLDRIEERIKALPKRIANDLSYGLYRECRSLVETLNMSKNPGSAHDVVERMVRELDADMGLIRAGTTERPATPDPTTHCAACGNSFDDDNLCMPSACQMEGTGEPYLRLSVNINDETAEVIRKAKKKRGWSTTETVRWAMALLGHHEKAVASMEDVEVPPRPTEEEFDSLPRLDLSHPDVVAALDDDAVMAWKEEHGG